MNEDKSKLINIITNSNSYDKFKNLLTRLHISVPHHHHHILYDIRTLLDNQYKIYTEIGKSIMSATYLLLEHKYNTKINIIGNLNVFENHKEIINKSTKNSNKFNYDIQIYDKNQLDSNFINHLKEINFRTDILYIVENHYDITYSTLQIYKEFVNPGGYIVIDNYNDHHWSPQIKKSVDDFIDTLDRKEYTILGSLPNNKNAFINLNIRDYNSFIIKKNIYQNENKIENKIGKIENKIGKIENKSAQVDIKFGVVVATYNRSNGKTPNYLRRCINSIINQTYTKWDLIVVGDKYEPEDELIILLDELRSKLSTNNKIIYLKNDRPERDFIKNKGRLWNIAGAASMNMGLKYCRDNGYKYYCHIDDDDYWHIGHLENFYNIYSTYDNCIFSNSRSKYRLDDHPNLSIPVYPNNLLPRHAGMIHSSISFRSDIIPFNYYTTEKEGEIDTPSDGKILEQIRQFILNHNQYCSIFTGNLTCYHDIEGESM